MIVTCERCDTKFQLDDAKVPPTGARVRCSRCKHAFLVLPADASGEETVHALAADAAVRESPTPAAAAEDLPESGPDSGVAAAHEPCGGTDEHDWQFADPERPPPPRTPRLERPESDLWRDVLQEEKPPEAMDLDALGSPESWSFVSEDAPPLRAVRAASSHVPSAAPPTAIGRIRLVEAPRPAESTPADGTAARPPAARMLERAGWALTGLLLLAIVHGIDWKGPPSSALTRTFALPGGLLVEDLSLRRLENLAAGPVLVVAGILTNPGSAPTEGPSRLRARVVGASQVATAEAAPPRGAEALRERPPAEAVPASGLLGSPLAPGDRVPFEAVIERPPRGDARLELLLESAEEQPATGDPSPPRPLPSSG